MQTDRIIFRKFLPLFLITTLMVILTGCLETWSPAKVMAHYAYAEEQMDTRSMQYFCTENFNNSVTASVRRSKIDQYKSFIGQYSFSTVSGPDDMIEWYEFSIDGDTAKVWLKNLPQLVYVMKKVNDEWRIDDIESDTRY